MISRTYGRRSRGLTRSFSGVSSFDVGSDSSSQECPQDVFDFSFPSQESTHSHFPDPNSLSSSQESGHLTVLHARESGDCNLGFWKSKKAKVIAVDTEPYDSSSYQESGEISVFEISRGDFQKSKKLKKVNPDPFEYYSSQESDGVAVLPPKGQAQANSVFEFSEDGHLRKSKKFKSFESDLHQPNSSHELGISQSRKRQGNSDKESERDSWKHKKKDKVENGVLQKKKINNKKMKYMESGTGEVGLTPTLMETQEFGEMMEHVDEVNFALDGLKKGQPVRIRRASLLSLLSISGTVQQRRHLRIHGMAKTIIDAVMGLSFDDTPSNLAAAALFYILTSDGQDDHLLDSLSCICFLIKLLKPLKSTAPKEKSLPVGSKLLGLCKNAGFLQDSAKGMDSSSTAIMLKVREMLVNCKEMKQRDSSDGGMEEPELSPKWISLLTMEKACSSSLSLEDTSGTAMKTGGSFKEKLRESGGLDAVFEVARKCHSMMEEWLEKNPTFTLDLKDTSWLESLLLLLKCLKIMENATFLSKNNQCHLLRMKGNCDGEQAPRSFTKLVLSVVKILSGVSLLRSSSRRSFDAKKDATSNGSSHCGGCCCMEWTSERSSSPSQCRNCLIADQQGSQNSCPKPTSVSLDPLLSKLRVESSKAASCRTSGSFISMIHINSDDTYMEICARDRQYTRFGTTDDSQDPFAFDEDEIEPSKWDLLSGKVKIPLSQDSRMTISGHNEGRQSVLSSQQESNNMEYRHSQETLCSLGIDEDRPNLLADCLLTAVKVLMNLSNDNPEGCLQIAACGGLEILSSLIAGHFPSFSSSLQQFDVGCKTGLSSKSSPRINSRRNSPLNDEELDFLVAILGLLVNLVEKDERNRSRLAAASVSLPDVKGMDFEDQSTLISLLCSIFLANQGDTEASGEGKHFSWDDEDSIIQGEKEAEKMIVEAHAALLLAFLSTESKSVHDSIAEHLPNRSLKILVPVLEKFVEFHLTLNMISPETHSAILEVIESCRIP